MAVTRLNYFNGQFLQAEDFQDEQVYHVGMRMQHNSGLHTWGIAHGLVPSRKENDSARFTVSTGFAIDKAGNEIQLDRIFDSEPFTQPLPTPQYITIQWSEADVPKPGGSTRKVLNPIIKVTSSDELKGKDGTVLVLGTVEFDSRGLARVDPKTPLRIIAGARGGTHFSAVDLTLTGLNVQPDMQPTFSANTPGQVDLKGRLKVDGGPMDDKAHPLPPHLYLHSAERGGDLGIGQQNEPIPYMRLGIDKDWVQYLANNAYWTGTAYNYVNPGGYGGVASAIRQTSGTISLDTAAGGAEPIQWVRRLFVGTDGDVGIGTRDHKGRLDIIGTLQVSEKTTFAGDLTVAGKVGIGTTSPGATLDVNGSLIVRQNTTLSSGLTVAGKVGIGTTASPATLDVNGSLRVSAGDLTMAGKNRYLRFDNAALFDDGNFHVASDKGALWLSAPGGEFVRINTQPAGRTGGVLLTEPGGTGKVGIGTESPTQKLEICGGGIGFSGKDANGVGLKASDKKLYSPQDGDLEWMTHSEAAGHGFAVSHQGTKKIYLNTKGDSYLNGDDGNVGIGTATPKAKLQVNGAIWCGDHIGEIDLKEGVHLGTYADTGITGGALPLYLPGHALGLHVIKSTDAAFFGLVSRTDGTGRDNYNTVIGWGDNDDDLLEFKFNNGRQMYLKSDGVLRVRTRVDNNSADLAEIFTSDVELAPGELVSLDPGADRIVRSSGAADTAVIGIVSTAPGFLLNAGGEFEESSEQKRADGPKGYPVALCGRVPCKVTDENGPIRRGDMLTASSKPGVAMRAEPMLVDGKPLHRPGTLVGKALENHDAGDGMIEVFVALR